MNRASNLAFEGEPLSKTEPLMADQIMLKCPACGACETAAAADLADRPLIVCRECGETWPVRGGRKPAERRKAPLARTAPTLIDAERRPLVSYSDPVADNAWKAKMEGDYWPEPQRSRRLPMTAAAVAALFFLGAFFGAREAAVAAIPDLAGLYAAVGMPVNLEKVAIEAVGAERQHRFEGERLILSASLRSLGKAETAIPPLVAVIGDGGNALATFRIATAKKTLGAGETLPVTADLGSAHDGSEVTVRFLRPGEPPPAKLARPVDG
jgi:hypothetical protein